MNADDLGLDAQIDRGIAACCHAGVVRSVSVVACGRTFDHGLGLIKAMPGVGVGVHLCLVAERPVLSAAKLTSLVDHQGIFSSNYRQFLFRTLARRINWLEVEQELEAQIKKVFDAGITPTHLDGHQYVHLMPGVFEIVMRLAVKYGVKWVRCPAQFKSSRDIAWQGALKHACLGYWTRNNLQKVMGGGVRFPDAAYGVADSGRMTEDALHSYLRALGDEVNDLTCHPGYFPVSPLYAGWGYQWDEERKVLTAPQTMALVRSLKIRLGNYADL